MSNAIAEFFLGTNTRVYITFTLVVTTILGLAIYDQMSWNKFSAEHECRLVAHDAGHLVWGYHNGHSGWYTTPSTDTYHCNDGVDYTR